MAMGLYLERARALWHSSRSSSTIPMCSESCRNQELGACALLFDRGPRSTETFASESSHGSLCKATKQHSGGWKQMTAPLFSAPLVSYGVFSLLRGFPTVVSNAVSLSPLTRNYQPD